MLFGVREFFCLPLRALFSIKTLLKMEKEIRNISEEVRADAESRKVDGYALVFNSLSEDLGGFREQILPEAIDGVIERSDIYALLNHDESRGVLARSRKGKGSLTLEVDEHGLRYKFEAPKTSLGDEVLEYLRRGDISQSSFAFTVDTDEWEKQGDGSYIRTIKKFNRLYDVSPVFEPAYQSTSVKCARFAEVQEADRKALEEAQKKAEEEAKAENEKIRSELAEKYKDYMVK